MGKQFEELAKALASGVSRRSALKRFAAGAMGAAAATMFSGRNAAADETPGICQQGCDTRSGRAYGKCVSECSKCVSKGGRPIFVNGNGEFICISVNSIN